jgi:integrase
MVRLQGKTGCRPEEITLIRPSDIDKTDDLWVYTPGSHKTEHHDIERKILIGTEAQRLLTPWLHQEQVVHLWHYMNWLDYE